jgi:hypothetical protein
MTNLDRDIQNWILRAVDAYERGADGAPMPDFALRNSIRSACPGVAFTDGDLTGHIAVSEENKFITGITNPLDGKVWNLTDKGRIRLNQLRK